MKEAWIDELRRVLSPIISSVAALIRGGFQSWFEFGIFLSTPEISDLMCTGELVDYREYATSLSPC
jgi:hypothetical protein